MPSNPARNQADGRLRANREKKHGKRKTTPKGTKVTTTAVINPRMAALLDGTLKVSELDDEEIERGRCRGPNGKFGKQSALVPAKFHQLMVGELRKRMEAKFAQDVEPMRKILKEIANNPRTSPDARYKSAVYLIDRGAGKVAEKTEAVVEVKKWEGLLDDVFVGSSYQPENTPNSEASTDEPAAERSAGKRKRAAKKDPFS